MMINDSRVCEWPHSIVLNLMLILKYMLSVINNEKINLVVNIFASIPLTIFAGIEPASHDTDPRTLHVK